MFFLWLSVEKSLEHRGDLRTACICLRCQQRPAAGCSAGDEADCHCPFNRFSRPACDLRLIGEGTQVCSCGNVLAVVLGEVEKDQGDLLSGDIVVGAELAVAVAGNDTVFIRPQDGVGVVSHTVPLFQLHFELWAGCLIFRALFVQFDSFLRQLFRIWTQVGHPAPLLRRECNFCHCSHILFLSE